MEMVHLEDMAKHIKRMEVFRSIDHHISAEWWGEIEGKRRYVIGSRHIIPALFVFDTAVDLWVGSTGRWYSGPVKLYHDLVRAAVPEYLEITPYEVNFVACEGYAGLVRKRMLGK